MTPSGSFFFFQFPFSSEYFSLFLHDVATAVGVLSCLTTLFGVRVALSEEILMFYAISCFSRSLNFFFSSPPLPLVFIWTLPLPPTRALFSHSSNTEFPALSQFEIKFS